MAHYSHPCARAPGILLHQRTEIPSWPDRSQILSALVWLIFPLTLGLAITRQSLWIDEGFTVWFASPQSFHSFFTSLIGSRGAPGDPQFIFYLLYMWEWIKQFGASELSLRAANIPFAVIFIYTMSWASRRFFWNANLWALFCLSPFFWFYLNEARPYMALIAFSSVASVALLAYLLEPERYHSTAPWFCVIALFIAWGTNILAIFLVPPLLVLVAITTIRNPKRRQDFLSHWLRPVLCSLPAFFALGAFYTWVSANGVNKPEGNPGVANLAFAFYEFAGFAGLGPPRNDIRANPNLSIFLPYWPLLLLGAVALIAAVISVFRTAPSRPARNVTLAVIAAMGFALLFSRWEHFQFLGRHLAALFPLTLIPAMLPPKKFGSPVRSRVAEIAFIALALVWALSDFRLVFLHNYQKDSYREACSIALARARQDGAVILWAADPVTAKYYGLNVNRGQFAKSEAVPGEAFLAAGWTEDQARAYISGSPVPTILVLSKANPFDYRRGWTGLLEHQRPREIARLNAFSVFEWQTPTDPSRTVPSDQAPPQILVVESSSPSNSSLE
jgi:hypothetical protein